VRILALDAATENCSVALLLDGHMITREKRLERGHAEHLLPMADEVLAQAGLPLAALSAIAFGRGPGAFTGVRLAASVTQGLAFGAGLAVVPISDLRALAQRVFGTDPAVARVLACTDARMREVYWGCFQREAGLAVCVGEERVSKPDSVRLPPGWSVNDQVRGRPPVAELQPTPLRLVGAGSGFAAYEQLRSSMGVELDDIRQGLLPRAAEIALLAAPEVAARRVFPPEQALPVYLRDEVAHASSLGH
jgi:tRNA threonylcarbamoyladenosine biosynthesis protein TsaB